jgi:hypothetical protein
MGAAGIDWQGTLAVLFDPPSTDESPAEALLVSPPTADACNPTAVLKIPPVTEENLP